MEKNKEQLIEKQKNFQDIINTLIETNEKLLNRQIDIATARTVAQNAQVLINAAKVHLEYVKFIGDKHDSFFNTEPIDITLKKIELENKKPYEHK